MKIGYHMLEGKSQSLKKPLVVLSKIPMAGAGDQVQYKVGLHRTCKFQLLQ
jgi:hypothetical protein